MKKYWNRIKTLYWFWRMTKHWIEDKWVIERGEHSQKYPIGKKWLEVHTPNEWLTVNRHKN